MNGERRRERAQELRKELDRMDERGVIMSPMVCDKFKRMIWDLEQPVFSELRRTLYMETIGGFGWGRIR